MFSTWYLFQLCFFFVFCSSIWLVLAYESLRVLLAVLFTVACYQLRHLLRFDWFAFVAFQRRFQRCFYFLFRGAFCSCMNFISFSSGTRKRGSNANTMQWDWLLIFRTKSVILLQTWIVSCSIWIVIWNKMRTKKKSTLSKDSTLMLQPAENWQKKTTAPKTTNMHRWGQWRAQHTATIIRVKRVHETRSTNYIFQNCR